MLKKILAVLLVLLLLVGFGAWGKVFSQAKFPDVPSDYWAYDQIVKLVELGILKGYPDGTFKPENPVTRAEFATMVVLAKKLTLVSPATPTFKDVPTTHWAFKYVETAVRAGYLKGYPDGTFGPNRNITRQEMAAVLINVLGLSAEAAKITEPICFANDENKISSWAVGVMTLAVRPKIQILDWDKEMNLRPTLNSTRADCSFGIYQILFPPTTNKNKKVVYAWENGPENFFPATSDSAYTNMAATLMYGALIGTTPDGILYPDMAVAVPSEANGLLKINPDGTCVVTYKLRKGLRWSDGSPITSDDIITGYMIYVSPEVNISSRWPYEEITKYEKVDNYTVKFYFPTVHAYVITGIPIYPSKYFNPLLEKDPGLINSCDYNLNPIHAGPFIKTEYVEDQYIIFKPNKYWYGGEPVLEQITVRIIKDTNTMLANVLTGGIDLCEAAVTLKQAQEVVEKRMGNQVKVYYNSGASFGVMDLNNESIWFKDKRVRQAIMYALDRDEVSRRGGVGFSALHSFICSGSWAYIPVLKDKYKLNIEKANKLLDEAGWKMGPDGIRILPNGEKAILKIPYATGARFREMEVTILEPMFKKIGIKVEHDPQDFNLLLDKADHGNFIIFLHGWSSDIYDPGYSAMMYTTDQIPTEENGWSGQNTVRYSNPEWDRLAKEMNSTLDFNKKKEIMKRLQEIFAEDVFFIPLDDRVYPDVVKKGLMNYKKRVAGSVPAGWNAAWWYWSAN